MTIKIGCFNFLNNSKILNETFTAHLENNNKHIDNSNGHNNIYHILRIMEDITGVSTDPWTGTPKQHPGPKRNPHN